MGPLLLDLKDTGAVGRAIGWARCYLSGRRGIDGEGAESDQAANRDHKQG